MSLRDLILEADDLDLEEVEVPEWKDENGKPVKVYIKQMSGHAANEYVESTREENGGDIDRNAKVLVASLCDKDGNRLFTRKDIDALNAKNARVLNHLTQIALEVNFKSNEAVEEAAKNS